MAKRIAISTIGTMGDIRPFLALALALKAKDCSVVLGAPANFKTLIESYGVEFKPICPSMHSFVTDTRFDQVMNNMAFNQLPALLTKGLRLLETAARATWKMAQGADAIIMHINTSFCIDIAEALNIPAIMTAFFPMAPTTEYPLSIFSFPDLGPTLNKVGYTAARIQQEYYNIPRDRFRTETLGLKKRKLVDLFQDNDGKDLPTLCAFSSHIIPRPSDWPASAFVSGYWPLSDNSGWSPSPELQAFLDSGPQPIFVGFGSMPFGADRTTDMLIKAMDDWGGRAIVASAWGGIKTEHLPPTMFPITEAPHDELFKLVRGVVHHGGAGTTAASLFAGKPNLVVAQAMDQLFWGRRVSELGLGPKPLRRERMTAKSLARSITELVGSERYAANARAMSQKLHEEQGANRAADMIIARIEHSKDGVKA